MSNLRDNKTTEEWDALEKKYLNKGKTMNTLEFKQHKGQPVMILIHYGFADEIGIEEGDEIGFKRGDENELYIYRLNELGPRFGNGLKISKGQIPTKGYTVYGTRVANYGQSGDRFKLTDHKEWDSVNDCELFEIEKQ